MQHLHAERYLTLVQRFAARSGDGESSEVTLDELARALYCTARNAKLILRRMEEEGWIAWQPGRGRGNRSRIAFRTDREVMLLETAMAMANRGDYKQAYELIRVHGDGTSAQDRFGEWLTQHFGYRTVTAEDGERQADMLRLPVHVPLVTLDPADVYFAFDAHIIRQLFDRLVQFDLTAGRVAPALAHAWESADDAKCWRFHLRRGVFFHHGGELTAADVVFTLERLRREKSNSWLLRNVVALEAEGRTVTITLAKPNRIFDRFLCATAASILPREALQRNEAEYWRHPSGTGPFAFGERNDDRLVLRANAAYHNGRAHLDGVVIAFVPNDHGAQSAKCWERLLLDHEAKEPGMEPEWTNMETLLQGCSLMTWNRTNKGPQRSPSFRKAVDLLIDRGLMLEELGEDRMYPARGFRPGEHAALRSAYSGDEQAKALLHDAGYEGEPFTLLTRTVHERDVQWIRERCAAFGIPVDIRFADESTCRDPELLAEVDAILFSIVFAEDEVCEIEAYEQERSFLNAHMDAGLLHWTKERIDEALAATTPEGRRFVLDEIEGRMREETQVLFLLHKASNRTYKQSLRGVELSPLGWIDFKHVWVQTETPAAIR